MSVKTQSFGSCKIARLSPGINKIWLNIRTLNLLINFEEALKLNLAIDECVRKMNTYKRCSTEGRRAALKLAIHFDTERIAVIEHKVIEHKE
jgi:hypothetical protein